MTKKEEQELKRQRKLQAELERLEGMLVYEREYRPLGVVCGIDEVGRGPLAGPVVAGAVILPEDCQILYLNDSKKLTERRRELLYEEIMEKAVARSGSMRSIFCRRPMKRCGRQSGNWILSRRSCSMML